MGLTTSPVLGCVRPGDSDFASTDAAAIERLMTTTRANIARCIADGHRPDIIAACLATVISELLSGSFNLDNARVLVAKTEIPSRPPTPSYEFRRTGDCWVLAFDREEQFLLPNLKGLTDIARLLKSPAKRIAARELMGVTGTGVKLSETYDDGLWVDDGRRVQLADEKAIADYRNTLTELPERVDAARDRGDIEEVERLGGEEEWLKKHLGSATDRHGGPRFTAGDGEKARLAVKKRITAAIKAIEKHNPAMALHLDRSIETGYSVVYRPEKALRWQF